MKITCFEKGRTSNVFAPGLLPFSHSSLIKVRIFSSFIMPKLDEDESEKTNDC